MGHDQGGPSDRGASQGAVEVSASNGARTNNAIQLAGSWGTPLFGEVVAEASSLGSVRLTCQRLPTHVNLFTWPSARR